MVKQTRRMFLTGAGALSVTLAGCSALNESSDQGGAPADDGSNDFADPEPTTETLADSTERLHEDEYRYYGFTFDGDGSVEYEFTVRSGPEIDVFVTNEEEFDHYENQERFRTYDMSSSAGGSGSSNLGSGSYYLVIDNTSAGPESPPANISDDVAEVEIEASVTY